MNRTAKGWAATLLVAGAVIVVAVLCIGLLTALSDTLALIPRHT